MGFDDRVIRYAASGDVQLAYMVQGNAPIDLIWASPGASNLESSDWASPWRDLADRFSAFSRFITFDARGAGLSDPLPPQTLPTLEERVDDVRAVLDAAESKHAVVFGQGNGGPTAILFAATYPDRVSSLVLCGTYARWLRDDDYPAGMPVDASARFREVSLEVWGTGGTAQWFMPSLVSDDDLRRSWARQERLNASPTQMAAQMSMWLATDVRAALPSISVPTLVVHRVGDSIFRVGHGRYLAEHVRGAKYLEYPGIDHFFVGSDLEVFAGDVEEFVTGKRSAVAADRVLATVMFTDIVDSTAKASEIGDSAWRRLLDRHDDAVRRQIERYRGSAFKHTGDGVAATFDGPARAITCACAIRDAVRGIGLDVRAGLHTGEIERRGGDVSGVGVHIAARVAQMAGPGEVLVSSTVKDLVVGSGIAFEDRGAHILKGVPDEWRLLSVAG
ncbi:MAG TPA: adenylate/guanylate cyclase domain-containing protein [Candidatus Dormibacteraeota bacterium]|nr:adenylate/guanylate cyclase domain-containing protein [Candidatus Dormibacteraeota bacterium]